MNGSTDDYSEKNKSIKEIYEMVYRIDRIDERIHHIHKQHTSFKKDIEELSESINDCNNAIAVINSQHNFENNKKLEEEIQAFKIKLQLLENSSSIMENKWKAIVSFSLQLIWVILAAFILYKLGIQAPAVP